MTTTVMGFKNLLYIVTLYIKYKKIDQFYLKVVIKKCWNVKWKSGLHL